MMKLGISSSSYAHGCSLEEGMPCIKKAGFDSVDFDMYEYSSPGYPMMQEDWISWVEGVRQIIENAGLFVGQAHAQLGLFAKRDLVYEPPSEIFYRNIKASAMLNCKELIFHPVFYPDVVETGELYEKLVEYNVRWFRDLAETAKEVGVHINIENTFDGRPQTLSAPFTRAVDILDLIERIGDDSFGICLDTGHAHIMSQDIPGMIREFGSHLRTLHLNDNLGNISPAYPDLHFFPGTGTVDFPAVFHALKEIGFQGIMNMEPGDFLARLSIPVRNAVVSGGISTLQAYLKDAGL